MEYTQFKPLQNENNILPSNIHGYVYHACLLNNIARVGQIPITVNPISTDRKATRFKPNTMQEISLVPCRWLIEISIFVLNEISDGEYYRAWIYANSILPDSGEES